MAVGSDLEGERRREPGPGLDMQDQAGEDLEYFTAALVSLGFTPRAWDPQQNLGQIGRHGRRFARLLGVGLISKGSGCR